MNSCRIRLTHRALCDAKIVPYYVGDDWSIIILFKDPATGLGLVLTGMSFRSTIADDATTVLTRDSADTAQIQILDQADPDQVGKLRYRIARTETTLVAGKKYSIDLVRVATDNSEQTWAIGLIESQARVTPTPLP